MTSVASVLFTSDKIEQCQSMKVIVKIYNILRDKWKLITEW